MKLFATRESEQSKPLTELFLNTKNQGKVVSKAIRESIKEQDVLLKEYRALPKR